MSVVFRDRVVKRWSQLPANHPAGVNSKPTRNVSNFTNRGKKCNIKKLLNDIQNMN